jgi:hypothetical protein
MAELLQVYGINAVLHGVEGPFTVLADAVLGEVFQGGVG